VRLATRRHGVFVLLFFLTFQGCSKGKPKERIPRCPHARHARTRPGTRCARQKNNSRGGGGIRGGHAPRNHTTLRRGGVVPRHDAMRAARSHSAKGWVWRGKNKQRTTASRVRRKNEKQSLEHK
jgi:hypothetical protein